MCSGAIRDVTVYMDRPETSNCRRGGRADTSQRPPKPRSNGSSRDTFRGLPRTRGSSRGTMCSPPKATMSISLVRGQPLRSNEGLSHCPLQIRPIRRSSNSQSFTTRSSIEGRKVVGNAVASEFRVTLPAPTAILRIVVELNHFSKRHILRY